MAGDIRLFKLHHLAGENQLNCYKLNNFLLIKGAVLLVGGEGIESFCFIEGLEVQYSL